MISVNVTLGAHKIMSPNLESVNNRCQLKCDSSCTGKLGTLFVSMKYVLVNVKLVCVYVKLLKT
jgi:hypothetical protein